MTSKSYIRKGGIGDDYIEHEDGSKSYFREGSIGDGYYEHEDGSKSFLRKGSIGDRYFEHEDGSKSFIRKGSFGEDDYIEHEDGSMSLLRKGGIGDSYYEHVGGKGPLSTSENDNEGTYSRSRGGSSFSDIIAAPFAYLFGTVVIFFIITAILQIYGFQSNIAELIGMGIANTVFIGGIVAIIAYIIHKKTGASNKIWIGVIVIWVAYFLITQLPTIISNTNNINNLNEHISANSSAVSVNNQIIPAGSGKTKGSKSSIYNAVVSNREATFTFSVPDKKIWDYGAGNLFVNINNNGQKYDIGVFDFPAGGTQVSEEVNFRGWLQRSQKSVFELNENGDGGSLMRDIKVDYSINDTENVFIIRVVGSKSVQALFSDKPKYCTFNIDTDINKDKREVLINYQ